MIKKSEHSFAIACQAENTLDRVGQKFKHTNLWMTSDSIQGSTEKRKRRKKWGSHARLSYISWWPKAVAAVLTVTHRESTATYLPHSPAPESAGEKTGANHAVMKTSYKHCGCSLLVWPALPVWKSRLLQVTSNLQAGRVHLPRVTSCPLGCSLREEIQGTLFSFHFLMTLVWDSALYCECKH